MTDHPRTCPACGRPFSAGHTSTGTRAGEASPARATHSENRSDTLAREIVAHLETIAARDKTIQEIHGQVAALQSELRDSKQLLVNTRLELNTSRPGAKKSGATVSTTNGRAYRDPTRMMLQHLVIYVGVAALCIAGTAALIEFFNSDRTPTIGAATTSTNAAYAGAAAEIIFDAELNMPVVIDDVEVILSNPRVGQVIQVSVLGSEIPSEDRYLKIDVALSNRSSAAETVAYQPWFGAHIKDDQGRKLRPFQTGAYELMQQIKGRIYSEVIKPGATATDIIIFPWKDNDAQTYTLTVDPDFRRLTEDERMVQISTTSFRLTLPRTAVEVVP